MQNAKVIRQASAAAARMDGCVRGEMHTYMGIRLELNRSTVPESDKSSMFLGPLLQEFSQELYIKNRGVAGVGGA